MQIVATNCKDNCQTLIKRDIRLVAIFLSLCSQKFRRILNFTCANLNFPIFFAVCAYDTYETQIYIRQQICCRIEQAFYVYETHYIFAHVYVN